MELTADELRDYYIAHAPPVPEWFEPALPEMPQWTPNSAAQDLLAKVRKLGPKAQLSADESALLAAENTNSDEYMRNKKAWLQQQQRERLLQWPLYWADEMMKRRQQAA